MTQAEKLRLADCRAELGSRRADALRLYEPTGWQTDYHASNASITLLIGGVRAGKTLGVCIEDARAVRGESNGKYPEKDGRLYIIGQNWKHIGLVIYPMLFKPGAFKIIRDLQTGQWRSFRPWMAEDAARRKEAKPAPPLIPKRFIKAQSFINKREKHISFCELENGWTIHFFSSDGEVPQGFAAHRMHIDEDVHNAEWVHECQSRLSDEKGRLDWSAMPHSRNNALIDLMERADALATDNVPNPAVVKFVAEFLDNPHIDDEEKQKRIDDWKAQGDDILQMRLHGSIGMSSLMYPTYHLSVHGVPRDILPGRQVPPNWTRYMVVDPGYQVCAVLFAVVPPPNLGDWFLLEGELYLRECTADRFGEAVQRWLGGRPLYASIIDVHGGRLRDLGAGGTIRAKYQAALKQYAIHAEATDHGFIDGSDDVQGRAEAVRLALMTRRDSTRRLKVLAGELPNLDREMHRYRRKTDARGNVTDEPYTRGEVHMCQNLEYFCAYNPKYHEPAVQRRKRENPVMAYLNQKRNAHKPDQTSVWLGPMSGNN